MKFDTKDMKWIHEPKAYEITKDRIVIQTDPLTDFWQRTYYGFQNDNAPALLYETGEPYFSFTVRTDFESRCRFDQCGIAVYEDSDNWCKASVEYENEHFQRLGSVVTNLGYSDWATTDISAEIKTVCYRLSRRESDFCIEYSMDGQTYQQMRIFHLFRGTEKIHFGIYACSPEDSSFQATFTKMELTDCKWPAHK